MPSCGVQSCERSITFQGMISSLLSSRDERSESRSSVSSEPDQRALQFSIDWHRKGTLQLHATNLVFLFDFLRMNETLNWNGAFQDKHSAARTVLLREPASRWVWNVTQQRCEYCVRMRNVHEKSTCPQIANIGKILPQITQLTKVMPEIINTLAQTKKSQTYLGLTDIQYT